MLFDVAEERSYYYTNALTSTPQVREKLLELERAELERVLAGSEDFKLLERIETVSPNHEPRIEYRALGSMGVFRRVTRIKREITDENANKDADENLDENTTKTTEHEWEYYNRVKPTGFVDSWVNRGQSMTIRIQFGMETLWRSVNPPVVLETCDKFEKMRSRKALSSRAQRVLARTNFKGRQSTRYLRSYDAFYLRSRGNRLFDLVVTILHISMMRKDYKRAYAALALLLRRKYFDHRAVYSIATELVQWKAGRALRFTTWFSATHQWTQLINGPMRMGKTVNPIVARVCLVLPMYIASMRIHLGALAAFERLESQVRDVPFSTFALNWALHGSLAAELGKWDIASRSFAKAAKLGGYVPWYYVDLINSKCSIPILKKIADPLGFTHENPDAPLAPCQPESSNDNEDSDDGMESMASVDIEQGIEEGSESDEPESAIESGIDLSNMNSEESIEDSSDDLWSEDDQAQENDAGVGAVETVDLGADLETNLGAESGTDLTGESEPQSEGGVDTDMEMDETDVSEDSDPGNGDIEPIPYFLATSELPTEPYTDQNLDIVSSPPAAQPGSSFGYGAP